MASINIELLKRLCETPGIASREDQVRAVVIDELRPLADELSVDALGNVIAVKKGSGGPRVMIAAHMDEIGFLVRHVDEKGFVRLQPVGGFDPRTLIAQRVIVHASNGERYRGAVQPASKPIHLLDPSEVKPPKLEELFVDIGLPADEVRNVVDIGDMVTLDRTLETIGDCVISKSLDDRVGVFVMIEALRAAQGNSAEIIAVATTQEEVGLRGARAAAFTVEPEIGIALDVTLAMDIPGGAPELAVSRLREGTALKVFDSSHLTNPKLLRHFRDLAEQHQIPYQLEVLPRGGTDAGAMQSARGGAAAITISIPTRYVHTVNETASVNDIDATIQVLARYIEAAGDRDYGYSAEA
ncbi:MAG TPA: M42 family metallopeptidase [Thermomicrobiales bacterium]|nr:M42 family metallopeptidase [Thermomicrobiales bacterium]